MKTKEYLKSAHDSLNTDSLAERVYSVLETSILNMELKPGEVLSEDEIAATLNVSRSPVREALLKLEHVGLVNKGRKHRTVAQITAETIEHNYHMWAMTESYAAGLACMTATEDDFALFRNLISQMEDKVTQMDSKRYHEKNYLFHSALVAPCADKKLVELHRIALNHIRWGYSFTLHWPEGLDNSNVRHRKLYQLYCERDRVGVGRCVWEHTENAIQRLKLLFLKNYR